MDKKIFIFVFMLVFLALNASVLAASCWDYDGTDQITCEAADIDNDGNSDDCSWDSWGQYCMEKGCWNYCASLEMS